MWEKVSSYLPQHFFIEGRQRSTTAIVLALMSPVVVGYTTGWFVGASQSPVVGTLLPLVFGLAGATTVLNAFGGSGRSTLSFTIASLGAILLCVFCLIGTRVGISYRTVQQYPTLKELIGDAVLDPQLTPTELGALHAFRLRLQRQGVKAEDAKLLFRESIIPTMKDDFQDDFAMVGLPNPIGMYSSTPVAIPVREYPAPPPVPPAAPQDSSKPSAPTVRNKPPVDVLVLQRSRNLYRLLGYVESQLTLSVGDVAAMPGGAAAPAPAAPPIDAPSSPPG